MSLIAVSFGVIVAPMFRPARCILKWKRMREHRTDSGQCGHAEKDSIAFRSEHLVGGPR